MIVGSMVSTTCQRETLQVTADSCQWGLITALRKPDGSWYIFITSGCQLPDSFYLPFSETMTFSGDCM